MILSDKELEIVNNTEFLRTKISIFEKLHKLFEDVQRNQKIVITNSSFTFPKNVDIQNGKIFKGENYRSLPYLVLDYPKLFSNTDTFSFRTMFLWGNCFSSTLHLEGKSLSRFREIVFNNIKDQKSNYKELYISVNDTPWEYHYGKNNYILLNESNIDLINKVTFLKLSKKYKIEEFNEIPHLSSNFLNTCLELLKSN